MSDPKTLPDDAPDSSIGETLRTIIFAMIIALTIRTLAFEPFNIPSKSMVPTLLVGDFLFVSKFSYGYGNTGTFWGSIPFEGRILAHAPQRGDVVVFKTPRDNRTDYIKRLIGLPGDEIQMRHGILHVNGVPVERERLEQPINEDGEALVTIDSTDYVEHLPGAGAQKGVDHIIRKQGDENSLDNTDVFTVPPHHYFFMGDNRDNSQDSRTSMVGYVPEENLVGKAEFLFFSLRPDAVFWQFWKWPWSVRWDRIFTKIT